MFAVKGKKGGNVFQNKDLSKKIKKNSSEFSFCRSYEQGSWTRSKYTTLPSSEKSRPLESFHWLLM